MYSRDARSTSYMSYRVSSACISTCLIPNKLITIFHSLTCLSGLDLKHLIDVLIKDHFEYHIQHQIGDFDITSTGCGRRMDRRKWKETKQQPSMLPGPAVPGSCLVSLQLLWAILWPRTVQSGGVCRRRYTSCREN